MRGILLFAFEFGNAWTYLATYSTNDWSRRRVVGHFCFRLRKGMFCLFLVWLHFCGFINSTPLWWPPRLLSINFLDDFDHCRLIFNGGIKQCGEHIAPGKHWLMHKSITLVSHHHAERDLEFIPDKISDKRTDRNCQKLPSYHKILIFFLTSCRVDVSLCNTNFRPSMGPSELHVKTVCFKFLKFVSWNGLKPSISSKRNCSQ